MNFFKNLFKKNKQEEIIEDVYEEKTEDITEEEKEKDVIEEAEIIEDEVLDEAKEDKATE